MWPISRENVLQLELGVGYRWYLNHPSIQSISILPNSRIDYRIFVKDVKINIHDIVQIQVDPISRPDLSGNEAATEFRRLSNTAGFIAEWRPVAPLGLLAGYDFTLDRSLTEAFTSLDRDAHTLFAGAQYTLTPRLSVGLNASYALVNYLEEVQNDATSYSVGPIAHYELSSFVSLDAAVGYAVSTFDDTGTIGDSADYRGTSIQFGVRHLINSRMSQELRLRQGADLGLGSNYNDVLAVQHSLQLELTSALTLHSRLVYEHLKASNSGGETASRYLYYLGTSYQLTRLWRLGAAYSVSMKDSDLSGRDYLQNRLTLDLSRQF
jgi:predicted porin